MRSNEINYVKRLKKGKEDALEFIVDKYLPLVKSTVCKVLSPLKKDGIIEECINDVFLSVWNNSSKFKGEESQFRSWIYKIAKFKAIDYYRKEIKNLEVDLEDEYISENKSLEEEIIMKEDINELIKLINTFEAIDRNIFIMKFFLGMKSEDIAKKLHITRSAVDNRIYRGKKKLNKQANSPSMEVI